MLGLDRLRAIHNKFSALNGKLDDSRLTNLNRTYTIKITRDDDHTGTYTVFGFNRMGTNVSTGDGAPAIVTINQSSHDNVKRDMAANPFTTMFCRYFTDDERNLYNPIKYVKQDSTGLYTQQEIVPIDYVEPSYRNLTDAPIYIPDFKGLVFDGSYFLTGEIEEDTEITMVITLQTKVTLSNAAFNQNILAVNNNPAPNTIDTVQAIIQPNACK